MTDTPHYVTPEEAKKMGCCMSMNRPEFAASCIGETCMAFRFVPDATKTFKNNITVICDIEDGDLLEGMWWAGKYAKSENGYLHRLIVQRLLGEIPKGMFVDHINGDTLNNRRGNLRLVTPSENAANAKARGGKSKHRGVHMNNKGKWVAQISKGGMRKHIGIFESEGAAAMAYDMAAKEMHGDFARLNMQTASDQGKRGFCGMVRS